MGQLKSGIAELQKLLTDMEPRLKVVGEIVDKGGDRVQELGKTVDQGYDVLYLYLTEKYKKSGSTPDAHAGDTLKAIADPNIIQNVKGIATWKNDLKAEIAKMNNELKKAKDDLLNKLTSAETQALTLKKLAEKKKDKWFKSAKYKEKIKTYLASLDIILKSLKTAMDDVKGTTSMFTDAWVEKNFPANADMTVAQVKDRSSMDLNTALTVYAKNKAEIDQHVRKWRDEYKSIPGQLATMKKWVDEADAMEKEAEEK
ncbi:MAG TPA: hypothetical protein VMB03_14815 [Bryobacteraceae bacterium]|nr:hypothetical protein [Bryobacteraceae bacterium]